MKINNNLINSSNPVYFIAEIGSNFDNSIDRAYKLIELAKESGAQAVKFQHYTAETLVSDFGFLNLKSNNSHQSEWKTSVFETYKKAEFDLNWTEKIFNFCEKIKIDFITSPYYLEIIPVLKDLVHAFKLGSGDITWHTIINELSKCKKPLIIATGASSLDEVQKAVEIAANNSNEIGLLQCNTNYNNKPDNFKYLNINVLNAYRSLFPNFVLGLSDHNKSNLPVLAAVSLGAKIIEKHFTDDDQRSGPDHSFALNPSEWLSMVNEVRKIESILGTCHKKVENNELDSSVVQRRSIRVTKNMKAGDVINKNDLNFLRPAPVDSIPPYKYKSITGKRLKHNLSCGDYIKENMLHDD